MTGPTNIHETDLAIVGGGPAGLATAAEAASYGASVTIFDDNALPGGQYFRQLPKGFRKTGRTVFDKDHDRGRALFAVTENPRVTYRSETMVWESPDDGVLAFACGADSGRIRARVIVIAAGAYDRPVPFPGWTLPGVITAGGVQNLIKGHRVIPGRRVAVAGNGPLVLLVAANLVRAGAELVAAFEAAPLLRRLMPATPKLLSAPAIVKQAITYRSVLLRAGVSLRTGESVVEARGQNEVEEILTAPIDQAGRIDKGRTRTLAVDTLVVGFGLIPSIELLRMLDCELRYDALRGGWLPVRDRSFETSVKGVFAVGDGASIGGVEIALAEGRLMGLVAAARLGLLDPNRAAKLAGPVRSRLNRFDRFRSGLERLYTPPASYLDLLTPETIVCRCEEITLGELRARQEEGYASSFALKGTTRIGMGRCQGRNCLRTLAALVGEAAGTNLKDVQLPRARPPARLVEIGDLLHEPLPEPDLPEDPHLPRGEEAR